MAAMASPASPSHPQPRQRALPINELIAGGALLALAAWAAVVWSGRGGLPAPLGPLDPGRWFPGRGLALAELPLVAMLVAGGVPLVWNLLAKLSAGVFGADLLAGISIVTSIVLGEYLAGVLVVLMLSGGEALESRRSRTGSRLQASPTSRSPRSPWET
jgi:cation transport ATPase